MSDQLDADALRLCAAFHASLDDADPLDRIAETFSAAFRAEAGPQGHQASAGERAGAYRQFAQARQRLYGRPPEGEDVRASLTPASASPAVRRLFGG